MCYRRSELRSRIFGLCLRQLQEICEHLEQGELSAFNLESTLDIPVGSNQNSLPTAASSCTTGSHINNNEKALLSIRDKLGSSCESFASTNGSPFLDANPTKIMPHVWSVESATKDFCLHINVNVLNKFVSNDNNWVLVLLSHIENSCMAFSLHCAPASGGQIRRNKAVAKHPIVYANKALARMYGFSRNELQGKPIDFAVSPVIPGTSSQKDRFSMNRSAKVQPTSPTAPTTTTNTTFTTTNTATTTGTSGSVRMNSSSSSSISGGSGSSLSSTPAVAGIVGGRNAIAEERATLLSFDMEQLLLQELQEVPSARVSLQGGGDDGDGLHGILTTLNDDSYRSNSTNQSKSVPLTHPEISSSENSISNSQPKFFLSVDPTIGSSSKDSCKEETPTGGTARDSINSSVLSLGASYLESSSSSKSRSAAATQAQVDTFTTKMESMRPSQVLFLRYRILRPRTQQEHNHISMCSYSQQPGEHVEMHVNSQASQQQTRKYIDSNSHSSGSGGGGGGDIVGSSYTHGSNCGASHAGDLPDYSACPSHNSGASSNPQQQHQNGTSYNELHSLPMAESFYATILVAVKGLFSSDNQQSLQYHVAIYSEILPTDDIADKCSTMEQLLLLLPNNVQNESVDEPILPDKSNAIRRVRDFITAKLG